MEFYKIGTENDVRVYKKTIIPWILIGICAALLIWAGVATAIGIYYNGKYNSVSDEYARYMDESRLELGLARAESERYADIVDRAKHTNTELGRSLQQSISTIQGIRILVHEIRSRYEEMENLLNSIGNDNSNVYSSNYNPSDSTN